MPCGVLLGMVDDQVPGMESFCELACVFLSLGGSKQAMDAPWGVRWAVGTWQHEPLEEGGEKLFSGGPVGRNPFLRTLLPKHHDSCRTSKTAALWNPSRAPSGRQPA